MNAESSPSIPASPRDQIDQRFVKYFDNHNQLLPLYFARKSIYESAGITENRVINCIINKYSNPLEFNEICKRITDIEIQHNMFIEQSKMAEFSLFLYFLKCLNLLNISTSKNLQKFIKGALGCFKNKDLELAEQLNECTDITKFSRIMNNIVGIYIHTRTISSFINNLYSSFQNDFQLSEDDVSLSELRDKLIEGIKPQDTPIIVFIKFFENAAKHVKPPA